MTLDMKVMMMILKPLQLDIKTKIKMLGVIALTPRPPFMETRSASRQKFHITDIYEYLDLRSPKAFSKGQ